MKDVQKYGEAVQLADFEGQKQQTFLNDYCTSDDADWTAEPKTD